VAFTQELVINDFSTTLAAGYTAGDGFLDLTATTGLITAPYTFTLSVYDQNSPFALKLHFRVTSISGSHAVGSVVEGSDANAASGDIVVLTMTALPILNLSGRELLTPGGIVASGSAQLDFTGITSRFDVYEIELIALVLATNNVDLGLQFSTDGGSTFSTSGYEFVTVDNSTSNAGLNSQASTSASYIQLFTGIDNSQSYGTNGTIKFHDPLNASLKKSVQFQVSSTLQAVARRYFNVGSGFWGTAAAVNAIRIKAASGNITSGSILVYGLRK